MNFQDYIAKESQRINKMTPRQKEYILGNSPYLPELGVNEEDIELELVTKDEAKKIIQDINEMIDEDLWDAYTHDW